MPDCSQKREQLAEKTRKGERRRKNADLKLIKKKETTMNTDRIIQQLNQRFAAPLPKFYKRRIIFWHDEDGEFRDRLDEIALNDAKIVALTGSNNFAVKKLLAADDTTSNYLVYCPLSYEKPEDNWLLDIELYSEEFRADPISIWMDELGIPATPVMRKQVKEYRKFMNAKARRQKIAGQSRTPAVPAQLHMAVMGALCGIRDVTPAAIIREVLKAGRGIDTNSLYREFVNYGADEAFRSMVKQGTGCEIGCAEDQPENYRSGVFAALAAHMLLTAATRTMRQECLAGLDHLISSPHQAFCFDFISDWLHGEDRNQLTEIAKSAEDELKLPERFMKMGVRDLADTEIFPCVDEVILIKLMTEIGDNIIDVDRIRQTVEKRRTCVYYEQFRDYYEGILQVANMQEFYKEHAAGFHSAEAKKFWEEYTSDYYRMDTYYRLLHMGYGEGLKDHHSELHDLFCSVMEKAESLYKDWFLRQLSADWVSVCSEDLAAYGRIPEIPQQTDFYKDRIRNAGSRVFVVISDALRYEVAASLAEQLRRETRADVTLQNVQGIFPTVTKFGMAALLPHKKLEVVQQGNVLKVMADGVSTDDGYRDKILKSEKPNSAAIQYNDLLGAKRADRSTMIKGMEVVYIYHHAIDEASHTAVFPACGNAIRELKNLTRIICNDFGATRILFTADHGFLYTFSTLAEDEKVNFSETTGEGGVSRVAEYGRRYAIVEKGAEKKETDPDYLQKVQLLDGSSEYEVFTPRENTRFKIRGGGLNFLYGGISPQEMVVPVIDYHFLRNQSSQYQKNRKKYDTKPVKVNLLSATHKVSNINFSLNFYQTEAVSDNREAAVYQACFTDKNGRKISDIAKIVADKTSDNGQERTFRCSFNLKSMKYDNKEIYYLVIADANGLVVSRNEFQIDIAFAEDKLDFFW